MAANAELYAAVKAKKPLDYKTRKALLSHWTPKIAKAICRIVYPDFRGAYEQHLWLLTHNAAETEPTSSIYCPGGYSSYAKEAKEKGVLFLWPYARIEDTRLCGPSHYLHYIVRCERSKINAILAGPSRCSVRLNAKYLTETLRLHEVYTALPRYWRPYGVAESAPLSAAAVKMCKDRSEALGRLVNSQMMLTGDNLNEFKAIAYGWTHLRKETAPPTNSLSPAAQEIARMDAELQARR